MEHDRTYPRQFTVGSYDSEEYESLSWDDYYVNASGYFGSIGPHVFAAAPDMLEALEAMRTVMDMGDKPTKLDAGLTWRQCYDKARDLCDAAIAKAKGETK